EEVTDVQHFIDTFTSTNVRKGLVGAGQGPIGTRSGHIEAEQGQGGQVQAGQGQAQSLRQCGVSLIEMLSERECNVLRLVSEGLSNQEIARNLVVTVSTVKTHLNNIYTKFQVHTRLQAVTKAYDLGLLSPWAGASPRGCETENIPLS